MHTMILNMGNNAKNMFSQVQATTHEAHVTAQAAASRAEQVAKRSLSAKVTPNEPPEPRQIRKPRATLELPAGVLLGPSARDHTEAKEEPEDDGL